ncbi:hypothetical protein BS17DRAFT_822500 [Gyrodon lividus]|nr:hypothetical protein BS17DRAFT_822500 [Gyrodon lividus]
MHTHTTQPSASSSQTSLTPFQYCTQTFSTCGIKSHEASCKSKREKKNQSKEFAEIAANVMKAQRKAAHKGKQRLHKEHKTATGSIAFPDGPQTQVFPRSGSIPEKQSVMLPNLLPLPTSADPARWDEFAGEEDNAMIINICLPLLKVQHHQMQV